MSDLTIHLALTEADSVSACPFCGSETIELQNTWTASYWLQCAQCGALVHDPELDRDPDKPEDHQASKEAAIAAWNRRVQS